MNNHPCRRSLFILERDGLIFSALLLSIFFCVSCSGGGEDGGVLTASVVTGAPAFDADPGSTAYELDTPVSAMTSLHGDVYVATGEGLVQVGASGLIPVDVYWEGSEPSATGTIYAMAARTDSILIAAENGIFHTYKWAVVHSPLSDLFSGSEIQHLAARGEGENEEIFVGTADAFYRVTPSSFEEIVIGEETTAPTALLAVGDAVLVAYEGAYYELDTDDWIYGPGPAALGKVLALSGDGTTAVLGTDAGMAVREAGGSYTLYTLGDGADAEVTAVGAIDGAGRSVGLSESGLVRVSDASPAGLVSLASGGDERHVAVDAFNNVWIGEGTALTGWVVGEPLLFSETVGPLFSIRCNVCHLDGSGGPKHDFSKYEEVKAIQESVFERVSLGQMPLGAPLSDDDKKMVLDWYQSGLNP